MKFNGRKIQVGDTIHVKPFVVTAVGDNYVQAENGHWSPVFNTVNTNQIERVEPGPVVVAEIVRYNSGVAIYTVEILGVGETHTFVRIISQLHRGGGYLPGEEVAVDTKRLSRLE
jgi:hypothetical protein